MDETLNGGKGFRTLKGRTRRPGSTARPQARAPPSDSSDEAAPTAAGPRGHRHRRGFAGDSLRRDLPGRAQRCEPPLRSLSPIQSSAIQC